MTDNVTELPRSKNITPVGWRTHADGIWKTMKDIQDLADRVKQQGRAFAEVVRKDMDADRLDADRKKDMAEVSASVEYGLRDTLALLNAADFSIMNAWASIDIPFYLQREGLL